MMHGSEFFPHRRTEDVSVGGCSITGGASESGRGNPFTFSPQLLHLHRDHEWFEDGDIQRHIYLQDLYICEASDKPAPSVSEFACHISGCSGTFSTLEQYELHYNSLHRHVCSSCRRSLPSARLLDIHIQEWHDSFFTILAQRKDMYQCLVEGCELKFKTSKHRKEHLIAIHKYPPDFRFDKSKKEKRVRETKQKQHEDAAMEVVQDACESEGVCELLCSVPLDSHQPGESMETQREELSAPDNINTPLQPQYTYRVPPTVCFGHGLVRGFRGRRK